MPRHGVERLLPLRALLLAHHAEAAELRLRRRLAGAELHAPARDQVERGGALDDPRRVVERGRQLHDAVAEADALGALRRGRQEHLGRARVRVLLEEVVLDLPDVVEADAIGQLHLVERVHEQQPLVGALLPRPRHLVLVEDPEAHCRAADATASRARPPRTRSRPSQAKSITQSTRNSRFTFGCSCHQSASDCTAPLSCWANISTARRRSTSLTSLCTSAIGSLAISPAMADGGLLLERLEQLGHVGLEVVAEQQPEGTRVRLDPLEEGIDARAQAHLAGVGRGRALGEPLEDLLRVALEQRRVQVLLRREVLVDQRLGDAGLLGDLVDRRGVVAAAREHVEGGVEDRGAAVGGAEAPANGFGVLCGGHN